MNTRRVTQEVFYPNQMPRNTQGGSSRARKMVDQGQASSQVKRNEMLAARNAMQSKNAKFSHNFAPNILSHKLSKQPYSQGAKLTSANISNDELAGKSSLSKKRINKLLPNTSKKSAITTNTTQQSSSTQKGGKFSKKGNKHQDMDSKSCKSFASKTTRACSLVGNKRSSIPKNGYYTSKRQRLEGIATPCHSMLSFGAANRSPDKPQQLFVKQFDEIKYLTKKNNPDLPPQKFKLWYERNLDFLTAKKKMLDFDLSKLEIEYDYDTDEEQIYRAKKLLHNENYLAMEFYVKDDPLILVGNLALKDYSNQKK